MMPVRLSGVLLEELGLWRFLWSALHVRELSTIIHEP